MYCYNGNKVPAVLTGRSTISGFDDAWFKSVSSERIFSLHGAYIVIFLVISFSLPLAEPGGIGLVD